MDSLPNFPESQKNSTKYDLHPEMPEEQLGYCYHCGTSWKWVLEHITQYNQNDGCYVLCEKCWNFLTPEQRLPYYLQLCSFWVTNLTQKGNIWQKQDLESRAELIRKAVLEGK